MLKPNVIILSIFINALLLCSPQAEPLIGRATVTDGDTLIIQGQNIRLHGIDAPEMGQSCTNSAGQSYRCGQHAAWALDTLIRDKVVQCDDRDKDRYGRQISVCFVDQQSINAFMVHSGMALAYRRYSSDYISHELQARSERLGLWQGQFTAPWEWRRQNR